MAKQTNFKIMLLLSLTSSATPEGCQILTRIHRLTWNCEGSSLGSNKGHLRELSLRSAENGVRAPRYDKRVLAVSFVCRALMTVALEWRESNYRGWGLEHAKYYRAQGSNIIFRCMSVTDIRYLVEVLSPWVSELHPEYIMYTLKPTLDPYILSCTVTFLYATSWTPALSKRFDQKLRRAHAFNLNNYALNVQWIGPYVCPEQRI